MQGASGFISAVSKIMARTGGLLLLGAALLVAVEVSLRYTRLVSLNIATELSSYALAVGATWALGYVVLERAHVRVDFLPQRVPPRIKAVLDIIALASLCFVGLVLTAGALEMVQTSLRLSARANTTLGTLLALPQGAWLMGLSWFTFVSLLRTGSATMALIRGDLGAVDQIAGAPTAAEEVDEVVSESRQRLTQERLS